MAATDKHDCTVTKAPTLYMALELSSGTWRLAFTVGLGQKPRLKTVGARSTFSLLWQIKAAKKRFGLPEDAPVISCYEAGRDGFWLHRFLVKYGVSNQVVDSSSIEVNRRQGGPSPTASTQQNCWRCSFVGTTASVRSGGWFVCPPWPRRTSGNCTGS